MRAVFFLAGLTLTSATDQGVCAINGMRAVDDMLDAAVFIWAATKRCDTKKPTTEQDPIRCTLNIASAVESLNAMVNVVMKAVEQCGHFETHHAKCGLAVGVLTKSFAGLAAASSGILAKCPNQFNSNKALITYAGPSGSMANPGLAQSSSLASAADIGSVTLSSSPISGLGECVVNIKDTVKSIFMGMKRILTIKDDCAQSQESCADNGLKLAAALAAIGEYLSGTMGKCTNKATLAVNSQCAQESIALARHLSAVGSAGVEMKRQCGTAEETLMKRLYASEHGEIDDQSKPTVATFALGAALPITAVFAFVGGSRYAKFHSSLESSESRTLVVSEFEE